MQCRKALLPLFSRHSQPDGVVRCFVVVAWNVDVVAMRDSAGYHSLPYNPKLKARARELRNAGNLSEALLWNQLKRGRIDGLDFDRQKIIGNYIVDFYCAEKNLVLEVDGASHDDKVEYDAQRDAFLAGLGLQVIHIPAVEVMHNLSGVLERLRQRLELSGASDLYSLPDNKLQRFPSFGGVAGTAGRGGAVPQGAAAIAVSPGGKKA